MSELLNIDNLDIRLRADLEKAEQDLREATPQEKPKARRRFEQALHRFSVWVFEGRLVPLDQKS